MCECGIIYCSVINAMQIPTEYQYLLMKYSKYICAATMDGKVNVLDIDNLRILNTFRTNNVRISDMDAQTSYLVTCGWAHRPQGTLGLAALANVFDLRAMVQSNPIAFHAGAAFVQMHPKMSTTCIIASQGGQLQVVDIINSGPITLRQVDIAAGTYMAGMVMSPSGRALAIWDGNGLIHLWGSSAVPISFTDTGGTNLDWGTTAEVSRAAAPKLSIDGDEYELSD